MMSLGEIRRINEEATRRARRTKRLPWEPTIEQRAQLKAGANPMGICNFPSFGDYVPKGWERIEPSLFCDKSGFGLDSEPALSLRRLGEQIGVDPEGTAYASGDEGQFQIYLHRYKRKELTRRVKAPAV
jgi:hypothetical protein